MQRAEIVDIIQRAGQALTEQYVYPDVGEQLGKLLAERLASGRYDHVGSPETLGALVTEDLQSINGDLHLRLKHHEIEIPEAAESPTEGEITRLVESTMGGVARVQHHPGNIGHLELAPYLLPPELAGTAVTAALQLIAPTRALLLDLRGTLGGTPEMVALICGYLFDEPVHLNTFYARAGEQSRQSWSAAYVPGPRFGGHKPVYVLTSGATFSAGEELTYDLQQQKRATVVGERTRGGAHPRIGLRLHPHLELTVPVARPVNPVSGTNWEGCGVSPDIEVLADEAFNTAYQAALSALDQRPSI
ncbi:MAG TPA: S41 family peptidase [Micromonospora sp.]|nr:S41 family peptidase [Micromonospora sp.]